MCESNNRLRGEGNMHRAKPKLGPVRGRFRRLRLAETPPHPDLLAARGEKETAVHASESRS
jgi:hypothetical protein